jgi:hypothetical protein
MADSSAVHIALVAKLAADPTLQGLCPGGVFFGDPPQNVTAFVIVSLVIGEDTRMFNARAFEAPIYLVKAVQLSASGQTVDAAAAQIDALLDGGSLEVESYDLMHMARDEYVRGVEPDDLDASIRWQHGGGRYRIWVGQ